MTLLNTEDMCILWKRNKSLWSYSATKTVAKRCHLYSIQWDTGSYSYLL